MTKDPVCGMDVDERNALSARDAQGRNHYFCSRHCRDVFLHPPEKKGPWRRFLERLARENRKDFGDQGPKCH